MGTTPSSGLPAPCSAALSARSPTSGLSKPRLRVEARAAVRAAAAPARGHAHLRPRSPLHAESQTSPQVPLLGASVEARVGRGVVGLPGAAHQARDRREEHARPDGRRREAHCSKAHTPRAPSERVHTRAQRRRRLLRVASRPRSRPPRATSPAGAARRRTAGERAPSRSCRTARPAPPPPRPASSRAQLRTRRTGRTMHRPREARTSVARAAAQPASAPVSSPSPPVPPAHHLRIPAEAASRGRAGARDGQTSRSAREPRHEVD